MLKDVWNYSYTIYVYSWKVKHWMVCVQCHWHFHFLFSAFRCVTLTSAHLRVWKLVCIYLCDLKLDMPSVELYFRNDYWYIHYNHVILCFLSREHSKLSCHHVKDLLCSYFLMFTPLACQMQSKRIYFQVVPCFFLFYSISRYLCAYCDNVFLAEWMQQTIQIAREINS